MHHFNEQNSKIFLPEGPRTNVFPGHYCGSQRPCSHPMYVLSDDASDFLIWGSDGHILADRQKPCL